MEEEVKSLKRKLRISVWVNALMVLTTFVFLIYAFINRAEAKKQEELAKAFAVRAQESATEALKQKDIAEQARQIAERHAMQAEEFVKRMEEASQKTK